MDKLTFGEQVLWLGIIIGALTVAGGCWLIHYIFGIIMLGIAAIIVSIAFSCFWSEVVEHRS